MQIHDNLIQGSAEWLAYRARHFNASDAPAMMGVSAYKTRSQLMHEIYTGRTSDVDAGTQARFDDGHRFEALARPRAELLIGDDLYPVVGSNGKLSASFDGLTMDETTIFEHKSLNDSLRESIRQQGGNANDFLAPMYRVQMEQQLMVSGAGRVLFMASKWDGDTLVEERHCWYKADHELRAQIVAGWAQFESDLLAYEHVEVLPAAVAAPVQDLPALSIRVDGQLTLNHNLVLFGEKLQSFIADINTTPNDDQSFADAEQAIKVMERAENALGAAEASALGQISTVDDMVRTVATYKELARKTRLMLEKMVKARKETIRVEIHQAAQSKVFDHIAALNTRLGKPYMPSVPVDFAGVMKGKKTVASLRDSVDTELARFKIDANAVADKIQINLGVLRELAGAHAFLFADTAQIVLKAADDLTALVKLRIADHEKAEADKAEAMRAKIAEEERIKAEKAAAETVRMHQVEAARSVEKAAEAERVRVAADTKRQLEEQAASIAAEAAELKAAQVAPEGAELSPAAQALNKEYGAKRFAAHHSSLATAESAPPTLRLGQIGERLGFNVTADFILSIGFAPAATDKAAKLYHESDFKAICAALIRHVSTVSSSH